MAPPIFAFNPMDPAQRRYARMILDAADAADVSPVQDTATPTEATIQHTQDVRELRKVLRLGSGQLLALAVQHYGPDVQFDMKELAQRSGQDVDTLLSKNRTLANSFKKRGQEKGWVLQEHGGWPKRFSIPASIHERITRIMGQSATLKEAYVYLCDAQWADPEEMTDDRVKHVPVHVYRNKETNDLHVILFDDERAVKAPTYIVEENELILPAGGLPG